MQPNMTQSVQNYLVEKINISVKEKGEFYFSHVWPIALFIFVVSKRLVSAPVPDSAQKPRSRGLPMMGAKMQG